MRIRLVSTVLAVLVAGWGRCVVAEDAQLWETRPNAFELHLGAGTPIGFLGVMYDRALWTRMSVSGGVGIGSDRRRGGSLQLAAGARYRLVQSTNSGLYVGSDYSTGGWRSFDPMDGLFPSHSSVDVDNVIYSTRVHWLNLTGGYEYRNEAGYAFRAYAGLATMLNPGSRTCVEEKSNTPCSFGVSSYGDPTILIFGIALGFTI